LAHMEIDEGMQDKEDWRDDIDGLLYDGIVVWGCTKQKDGRELKKNGSSEST
jgi:hypothetical protein